MTVGSLSTDEEGRPHKQPIDSERSWFLQLVSKGVWHAVVSHAWPHPSIRSRGRQLKKNARYNNMRIQATAVIIMQYKHEHNHILLYR